MTFIIMTLIITTICHYAECRILFFIIPNVVVLSVIMLNVTNDAFRQSVIMLNVIMQTVVAPILIKCYKCQIWQY